MRRLDPLTRDLIGCAVMVLFVVCVGVATCTGITAIVLDAYLKR